MHLIKIQCLKCGTYIVICRSCWRGHSYCCDNCKQLGYKENSEKAKRKYRSSEQGKKKRKEAEIRRRLRIPLGEQKKNKKIRKNRRLLSKKQNNPATTITIVKKENQNQTKTATHKEKNQVEKKSTKGSKGVCHFCGVEGVIVKKISGKKEKGHPHFSFRMKRWEKIDKKNKVDKDATSTHFRFYWQRE